MSFVASHGSLAASVSVARLAALAGACRANVVGGGIAGTFERPPHVPGSDCPIRSPAFSEGEQLLRLRHVLLAVGHRPALLDAQVVNRQNVWTAQAKDQKHFNGPRADPAHRDKPVDEFLIGHGPRFSE